VVLYTRPDAGCIQRSEIRFKMMLSLTLSSTTRDNGCPVLDENPTESLEVESEETRLRSSAGSDQLPGSSSVEDINLAS